MIARKLQDLKSGKLSAVDNAQHFISVVKEKNQGINSVLHINKSLLGDAENVDKKLKAGRAGRLAGLVFVVKSNINVFGLPANCGSRVLENYISAFDADVIGSIRREDGLILGMANMDEFACGSSGESSAFGVTDNPAAPGRIPGGSSSGSAASVAAGMCDLALGSDTGGSVRNPASHCGVVGVKPSYGRVSRFGLVDMCMSIEQVGVLSPDVQGAALVMEVISGKSNYDGATFAVPVPNYNSIRKPAALRIGLSPDFEALCSDRRIYELVSEKAKKLAGSTKSRIVSVRLENVDLSIQAYYPLVYVEFFSGTRKFDGLRFGHKIEDYCGEEVLRRILGGAEISKAEHHGAYYRKALMARRAIAGSFGAAFREADVVILPTTPELPHKLGTKLTDPRAMYAYDAFTIPANLSGVCAGVVNVGKIDNVPVGLQVMAPAFREDLLFSVMAGFEEAVKNEG